MKIEEKLLNDIEEITNTNFEIKNNEIDLEKAINVIENLTELYKHLNNEFEAYKNFVSENYTQNKYYDEYF